jgi:hypothetical protein
VSIVNNGIISVNLEARSRRRERTRKVDKIRARGSGGEGQEEKGKEGRETMGKSRQRKMHVLTGPDSRTWDTTEWRN